METPVIPSLGNGLPPRPVLLAELDPQSLNLLPQTLTTTIPDLSVDLCTSRGHALSKLSSGSYHAIIANAHLALMDNSAFLKHHHSIQPHTPLLVSIGSSEYPLARQALHAGAFDVLVNPVDAEQTLKVVRPALWLYQLRVTIQGRQERLRGYRQRLTILPISTEHKQGLKQSYADLEEANDTCWRTIEAIESSLRQLQNIALNIETETRQRRYRAFGLP
jgi:DNA-binding NtrC family response regulator